MSKEGPAAAKLHTHRAEDPIHTETENTEKFREIQRNSETETETERWSRSRRRRRCGMLASLFNTGISAPICSSLSTSAECRSSTFPGSVWTSATRTRSASTSSSSSASRSQRPYVKRRNAPPPVE